MRMKISVPLLILLFIISLAGCEPVSINTYTIPDCGCTVRIGGEVKRMHPELAGSMYMFLYGSNLGGITYSAGYVELPGPLSQEFESSTWAKLVRIAAQQYSNGKFLSAKRISLDGHPGREFKVIYRPDVVARFRMAMLGARVYLVGINATREEELDTQRMEAYLDSFRIAGVLSDGRVPENKMVQAAFAQKSAQMWDEMAQKNRVAYSDLLKNIQTAKSAKVILVDTTVLHAFMEPGDRESAYSRDRCEFTTQDPAQIASLVNLIRANVPSAHGGDVASWPSAGIFLEMEDGEKVEFRFGETWVGPVGVFVRDESNHAGQSVYLFEKKLTFERDIYQWARSARLLQKEDHHSCFLTNPVNDYDFKE